jgi:hypothetical protein
MRGNPFNHTKTIPPSTTVTPTNDLDKLVGTANTLKDQVDRLKYKLETVEQEIATHLPTESGTHHMETDNYSVTLKRRENWVWDNNKLATMYKGGVPSHVNQTLSVHRNKFKNLHLAEQTKLKDALTVRNVKPVIEIRSLHDV